MWIQIQFRSTLFQNHKFKKNWRKNEIFRFLIWKAIPVLYFWSRAYGLQSSWKSAIHVCKIRKNCKLIFFGVGGHIARPCPGLVPDTKYQINAKSRSNALAVTVTIPGLSWWGWVRRSPVYQSVGRLLRCPLQETAAPFQYHLERQTLFSLRQKHR